jgi:hypothetical protein
MGNGKKKKLKKEGKYNEAAGLETGEFRKAKWTDESGNKRSWKEGPFRNRAVETWNGDKTVYKSTKNPKPYEVTHIKKKSIRKPHTVSYETGTPDEYEEKVTGIKIGKNIIAIKKDAAGLKYKETKKNKRKGKT